MLPGLKQNLGHHKAKDQCEAETVVTVQLVTQAKDFYQQGIENLPHMKR
jgi:hypothetical protein